MAFANFAEDDPFGDVNAAGAPESPVRVACPKDLDLDEVNELERVRRANVQTLIEERRAIAGVSAELAPGVEGTSIRVARTSAAHLSA